VGLSTMATLTWHSGIDEIDRDAWNALADRLQTPFFDWAWLRALEITGCLTAELGWQPCHLVLHDSSRLLAAAPLYVKGHSWGEFVFDQQWAEVSHRLGVPYYPKMVGMSPFTPAIGYRFLIDPELDAREVSAAMLGAIDRFCEENAISGCHFLHVDGDWCRVMEGLEMKPWLHHSLVWENEDLADFEGYVASFKSKQRNNIRRERRKASEHLVFRAHRGEEAPPHYFALMYDFYETTCVKFYGWSHYLNRDFFVRIGRDLPERTLMIAAHEKGREDEDPIAMSFQVRTDTRLYGRYWGCYRAFDQLHFEICYYQPIEWAIANGVRFFDAGSGNARHKQRRGFPARENYSLHRFYHDRMRRVWADHIDAINAEERLRIEHINRELC